MEFADEYEHVYDGSQVMYTSENIPTNDTENSFRDIATGCTCNAICSVETGCSCLYNFKNYNYDPLLTEDHIDSIRQNYILEKKDMPIFECNQNCTCSKFCGNRLVQYGPRKNLKIIYTDDKSSKKRKANNQTKGAGLFTTALINSGNFICEYAGELITEQEANARFKKQAKMKTMNYIFCINEAFGANVLKVFIDPTNFGNIGRYINHSCVPNCEVFPVRANSVVPKICIFANKDIQENEEITFDYGDGALGFDPDDKTVRRKKHCLCNYINCRKFLPFCKEVKH